MDEEGLEKVPVVGPSSETDYIDIPLPPDAQYLGEGEDAAGPF